MISYGSVCSGIEAASVAWESLGAKPSWFSEIEKFPSAVLSHHYPYVQNLGDMTRIASLVFALCVDAPDVLVGGTPYQAFSTAGLRGGLSDPRGALTLSYVELANVIDSTRELDGLEPCITIWENVPGVLSSKDNAFGCFLAGLAGEDEPLQPPGRRWTNAGYVLGPQRAVAWRILDAQYFGVAQRRRRVFVVASAREGFDPAAALFGFEGVRRDSAPSRETGEEVAPTIRAGAPNGGAGHGARSGDSKDELIVPVITMLDGQTGAAKSTQVRRLTPVECERLQGFPDNYTAIPWRKKKSSDCPDGPRYKAIGNSMAVPVMKWLGRKIFEADAYGDFSDNLI